jgi:nicotinamide mononucleotide transporter
LSAFPWLEVSANIANAAAILFATRNSVHTWWLSIVGCALFAVLFYTSRLYADMLLQGFFIATSGIGWWKWLAKSDGTVLEVTRLAWRSFGLVVLVSLLVAGGYGYALWRFTDAYAPFIDSMVLALSVAAQLLLMVRKYDSWWLWLAVNTLSVALFTNRGLYLTAVLYFGFWVNAIVALVRWKRLMRA